MNDRKLLIICGPTGVGKTSLGLKLAREFNGEIVSADSRQVYRYMNIVTGKDVGSSKFKVQSSKLQLKVQNLIKQKMQVGVYKVAGIPIWGLDLVEPDEEFSVALWRRVAEEIVKDIWKRGKLPIVVGGTGLYLKALTEPMGQVEVPRDEKLRKSLKGLSAERLFEMLRKEDLGRVEKMNESDRRNPRRLVRAIEIAKYSRSRKVEGGRRKENTGNASARSFDSLFLLAPAYAKAPVGRQGDGGSWGEYLDVKWVGLRCGSLKELYETIDERVEERLADERIVGELESLLDKDYLRYAPSATIGYQQLIAWMGGEVDFEEMAEKWKFAEHGYARRQMTWFRNQCPRVEWFGVEGEDFAKGVEKRVGEWLED